MKTILAPVSRRMISLIVLIALTIMQSCQDQNELDSINELGDAPLTISNAKLWFESKDVSKNLKHENAVSSLKRSYKWEKAKLTTIRNKQAVVLPIEYEGGLALSEGSTKDAKSGKSKLRPSTNRLVIFKTGSGLESQIVRSTPTRSRIGGYSGEIRVYDSEENYIIGYAYDNGTPVKVMHAMNSNNTARTQDLICGNQCYHFWTCYPAEYGEPDDSNIVYGNLICHYDQVICEYACDYVPNANPDYAWQGGTTGTPGSAQDPYFYANAVPSLPVISDQEAKDLANEMMRFQDTLFVHIMDACEQNAVYNYALSGRMAEVEWKQDVTDCLSNAGIGVGLIEAIKNKDILKGLKEIFLRKGYKGKTALRGLLIEMSLANLAASACISAANDKFEVSIKQANATYRQEMRSCMDDRQ